jgi:hypothetical protein
MISTQENFPAAAKPSTSSRLYSGWMAETIPISMTGFLTGGRHPVEGKVAFSFE